MKKIFVILFSLIMISGVAAMVAGADGADIVPKSVPASTTDTTASDADASATDADAAATTSSDADAASATDADAASSTDADAASATDAEPETASDADAVTPTEPTATEPTATEPVATSTEVEPTVTPTEVEPTVTPTDADVTTSTDADATTPTDADATTPTDADAETPTDVTTSTDADAETPTDATETDTKPVHKHDFRTIAVIGATCTEDGEVKLYCNCGEKSSEKIPPLGHDYVWKNNGNGTETQVCSRCGVKGETRPVETEPVHEHSYSREVTKAATCTAQGEVKLTCECGDTKTQSIPALGHNYVNYVYNNDATIDADGTETGTCSRCGAKHTRVKAGTKLEPDTALEDAKAAAKKAIDDACPKGVSDEVLKIAEEAKNKIDNADSVKKVDEAKNNGLTLIQQQKYEDCHYCGLDHSGFPGIFVKVFHSILYFFRNLFNR